MVAKVKMESRVETAARLRRVANDILEHMAGRPLEAANALRDAVERDQSLYRALMDPLVAGATWQFLRRQAAVTRRDLWDKAAQRERQAEAGEGVRAGLAAVAAVNARSILADYLLPNGKALGDATRDDLLLAIDCHRKLVSANTRALRFFELVLAEMGDAEHVGEALNDAAAERLQALAWREVPPPDAPPPSEEDASAHVA